MIIHSLLLSAVLGVTVAGAADVRTGTLLSVADGDTATVRLDTDRTEVKVRFLAIDTPETHFRAADGRTVNQNPWGTDASNALKRYLPVGTRVTVHGYGTDSYGRTLGRIFIGSRDANLAQIEQGMAVTYFICGSKCNADYIRELNFEEYRAACRSAKRAGKGIYNPANPLLELPFEFRAREGADPVTRPVGNWVTKDFYAPNDYARIDECDRIFFGSIQDAQRLGFRKAY